MSDLILKPKMNQFIHKREKGFSLAEAMMATVILGIAASGVLLPFTSGAAVQAEGTNRTLAAYLANNLVEKIAATDFDQIVSIYDGYSESKGHLEMFSGSEYSDNSCANFSISSACQYVYLPQQSGISGPDFILVNVNVYYSGRELIQLNRLVSR